MERTLTPLCLGLCLAFGCTHLDIDEVGAARMALVTTVKPLRPWESHPGFTEPTIDTNHVPGFFFGNTEQRTVRGTLYFPLGAVYSCGRLRRVTLGEREGQGVAVAPGGSHQGVGVRFETSFTSELSRSMQVRHTAPLCDDCQMYAIAWQATASGTVVNGSFRYESLVIERPTANLGRPRFDPRQQSNPHPTDRNRWLPNMNPPVSIRPACRWSEQCVEERPECRGHGPSGTPVSTTTTGTPGMFSFDEDACTTIADTTCFVQYFGSTVHDGPDDGTGTGEDAGVDGGTDGGTPSPTRVPDTPAMLADADAGVGDGGVDAGAEAGTDEPPFVSLAGVPIDGTNTIPHWDGRRFEDRLPQTASELTPEQRCFVRAATSALDTVILDDGEPTPLTVQPDLCDALNRTWEAI